MNEERHRILDMLAAEQGANPLTVAKAYQTFQDEGLIVVRRGVGMFVAEGAAAAVLAASGLLSELNGGTP